MNWKQTTNFFRKLPMDNYNKVLFDIDVLMSSTSPMQHRYSQLPTIIADLKTKIYNIQLKIAANLSNEQSQPIIEEFNSTFQTLLSRAHPPTIEGLLKANRERANQPYESKSKNRHMLTYESMKATHEQHWQEQKPIRDIQQEIDVLNGYLKGVDTKKIVEFFQGDNNVDSNNFLDTIKLENFIPLMKVIALVEDAFWHNKLNEDDVKKAKAYIIYKYMPDYKSK